MMTSGLQQVVDKLAARLRALETNPRAEVGGGTEALLFAALPTAGQPGRLRFVTNGRKVGEGGGAGTGVLAYDDGTDWFRSSDDTPVAV
jgi:hypothetical protein